MNKQKVLRIVDLAVSSKIASFVKVNSVQIFVVDVNAESSSESQSQHCSEIFQKTFEF
jgi:hypothetical protein